MTSRVKTDSQKPLPLWISLPSSGVSGMIAWMFTHPFEMLKNRLILGEVKPFMHTVREVHQLGWYKGIDAGLLRQVFYATSRLGLYDPIKNLLVTEGQTPTLWQRAVAGGTAGAIASLITSPIEVTLVMQTKIKERTSVASAMGIVYRDTGVSGFWRGCGPLMMRATIVGVSQVAMYDQIRSMLSAHNTANSLNWSNGFMTTVASASTGLEYALVTMPIELARVRMSSEQGHQNRKYRNVAQTIYRITREEGFSSIYRSFLPYYSRCSIHTIVCFFVLETINDKARQLNTRAH